MVNRVILVGRLGRDPEMRYTPGGIPVCSFSVACDSGYGDSKKTVWFRVSAWRRLAETCNEYLAKGRLAYVEGCYQSHGPTRPRTANGGPAWTWRPPRCAS